MTRPMTRMSKPAWLIQTGIEYINRPRGGPRKTKAGRQEASGGTKGPTKVRAAMEQTSGGILPVFLISIGQGWLLLGPVPIFFRGGEEERRMTTKIACRRRHRRHRMAPDGGARLEFRYPQPNGLAMSVALLDLSPSGFSFSLTEELHSLEPGVSIDGVTMKLGETEIRGDILVIHINIERGVSGRVVLSFLGHRLDQVRSAVAAIGVAQGD